MWFSGRLCRCLRVCLLDLSEVKPVGFVKCLLNASDMSLLEFRMLLLKVMDRLGSVGVGSLLLRDLMVFQ